MIYSKYIRNLTALIQCLTALLEYIDLQMPALKLLEMHCADNYSSIITAACHIANTVTSYLYNPLNTDRLHKAKLMQLKTLMSPLQSNIP